MFTSEILLFRVRFTLKVLESNDYYEVLLLSFLLIERKRDLFKFTNFSCYNYKSKYSMKDNNHFSSVVLFILFSSYKYNHGF